MQILKISLLSLESSYAQFSQETLTRKSELSIELQTKKLLRGRLLVRFDYYD